MHSAKSPSAQPQSPPVRGVSAQRPVGPRTSPPAWCSSPCQRHLSASSHSRLLCCVYRMTAGVDGEDGHRRSRHIRDVTADVGTVAGATDLPVVSSVSATARRHPRRPAPGSVIHASTLAASFDPPAIQTSCPRSNITDLDQPSTKHVALVVRPSPLLVLALQCSLTVISFHLPGTINAIHFNPVPDQAKTTSIKIDRCLQKSKRPSFSRSSRSPVANARRDPDQSKQPDPNTPVQSPPTKPKPGRSKAKRPKGGSAKKKRSKHGSTTNSGGGGGGSGSGPSSSSSTGSNSGSDDLLSDATLARLPDTVVDRRKWFPGYRRPRRFSSRQVDPWPAVLLKHICIRKLQANDLFHAWSHPDFWLFPAKSATPAQLSWYPHLITEANVRALYASEPWTKLRTLVVPHSFDPDGWFKHLYDQYSAFEDEERQTIWESTHSFPIGTDLRANSAYLDKLAADRKQRRSHAGPRWKKILTRFLEGMRLGHCDLDICLDPFFLHFPRKDEQGTWFPGLGQRRAPVDL